MSNREGDAKAARTPPKGTVFSARLLRLSPLPRILERPLWHMHLKIHGPYGPRCPLPHFDYGDWVDRGDALCSYSLKTSLFRKSSVVDIVSPVSGLLLGRLDPRFDRPWSAILLPEAEPAPEPAERSFGALCDYGFQHRGSLFDEISRRDRLSDEFAATLRSEFVKLRSSDWTIQDLSGNGAAYPEESYAWAIEDLRESRPHLREALRTPSGCTDALGADGGWDRQSHPPAAQSERHSTRMEPRLDARNHAG